MSEIETINTAAYYHSLDPLPQLVLSMHSALDSILYPYGYRINQYPDNVDEIRDMGNAAVEALNAVHGQNFYLMNAADLYEASGASDDYYCNSGSRFVFTPELRDSHGFLLPPEYIIPSGEEFWAAFKAMMDIMLKEMGKTA